MLKIKHYAFIVTNKKLEKMMRTDVSIFLFSSFFIHFSPLSPLTLTRITL